MSEENSNAGDGQNANNDAGNNSNNNSNGDNAQNAGTTGDNGNTDGNGDAAQSKKTYDERITELDKREQALDVQLKKMETLSDKITAGGKASGSPPTETAEVTQKKTLMKNFGDCIDGLDKMI